MGSRARWETEWRTALNEEIGFLWAANGTNEFLNTA
jgi:hypothetical protein